ncbi:MAG: hypothetical protein C0619_03105 [Desulfuromonas sp.]|nr:MAG: hypothetical protein C0619_03105 [Desulfuromonas sp.]
MTRQLKILEHTLASLLRRKAKNLSLLVVYAFTIATLGSVLFLTHALKTEASDSLAAAPELVVQRLAAGRNELIPVAYAERIRALPGVEKVTPRVWGYYYDALVKANFTLMGTAGEAEQIELLEGHLPSNPDECAVGSGVAAIFGAEIGDRLVLIDSHEQNRLYKISGLFSTASSLLTNDLILLPETTLREFFAIDEQRATDLAVEIYNQREVKTLAKKIRFHLPDTRPITRSEILHTYTTIFNWRSGMMLAVTLAALIAFCILAWDKATGISSEEKREIGILKALGWETADVLAIKFWEGLAISLTAFLLGIVAAWLHVFVLGAPALVPILKGWSVIFPDFPLTARVDLLQLLTLAFLTIVPYLACTLIPAWKTAVTDPEQVMRN